jgi:hypothetical protein
VRGNGDVAAQDLDPGHGGEECRELARDPGENAPAARREKREVAAELQRIDEAFLVGHQHGAPGEVGVRGQQAIERQGAAAVFAQAVFIVGPRFRHSAGAQHGDGTVEADRRIIGAGGDGDVMRVNGGIERGFDGEHRAEIGPAGGIVRPGGQRATKAPDGGGKIAEIGMRDAGEVEGGDKIRLRPQQRRQRGELVGRTVGFVQRVGAREVQQRGICHRRSVAGAA